MPAALQVELLRFLADGAFTPVGARHPRRAEVRVVSTTHRDLAAMVAAGSFREDLFFRLKGMILRTPALAERPGGVPLLADLFARRAPGGRRLAPDAMPWVAGRDWPGNVRELRAVVETACALAAPGEGTDAARRLGVTRVGLGKKIVRLGLVPDAAS